MSVNIVTGNRLEDLFANLAEQLVRAPLGPMETETILVPGKGIARWLELRLAEQIGIAAGVDTPFIGAFLHRLSSDGKPHTAPEQDPFSRDALALRIWRLISERLNTKDPGLQFGPATDYCKEDHDGRKRLQLCQRLAACFDDYQLYRCDLLTDFAAGNNHKPLSPHAPWQAQLWRSLLEDAGLPLPAARDRKKAPEATPFLFAEMAEQTCSEPPASDSAHRLVAIQRRLNDPTWCRDHLPKRLSIFGTSTMPPAFLHLLRGIAEHSQVDMYVPLPTPHYFGDLRERRDRVGDNGLLARFGTESREFADTLIDLEDQDDDALQIQRSDIDGLADPATPTTLLSCLQHDIVQALDRGEQQDTRFKLQPTDASLRVHDCHSPQRELEVVRDQICEALDGDPSLEARDIMVLVPDIDRYAPYAHAVFGPLKQQLPFYVADRHPARELPICRSVLGILDLGKTRLTLADVLHLLENTAVQRRFELSPTDIPSIRHLCHAAGIRWGLDGESRSQQFDLPAFDDNAWLQGIDRLLLGTLTGPTDDLVIGRLPIGDTTEGRTEMLARFVSFTRTLFAHVKTIRSAHTFMKWADHIDRINSELFAPAGGDEEDAVQQLQSATQTLRQLTATAKHTEPVSLAVMHDWLSDRLAQAASTRGFLGGSITVAAMLPMRAVPIRCLFLCGLDDESFPRNQPPSPFDLIQAQPRPLDRNRRLDDRQLFLDLLLAARDRLHLSYVGHSAKDNSEGAPSVVLAELLDHVDRSCVVQGDHPAHQQIIVQHPLQPWSPRYHDHEDQRLFTYAQRTRAPNTLDRANADAWCPASFSLTNTTAEPDRCTVDDLLSFWWHPCRSFLRESLRLRLLSANEQEEADEPFSLDALARYQLQDEAVRNAQRGSDHAADPLAWTRAKGVLPVGAHGAATFHALQSDTQQLMDEAHRYAKTTVRKIDLKLDSIQIVGSIEGFGEEDLVYMRVSKLKPKDQMRAWLMHLIVALQRIQDGDQAETPWPTTTRVLTSSDTNAYSEVPEDVAREHLLRLLSLREEGLTRPLPFFEKCSHAVGTALHKGKDESTALRQGIKDYATKNSQNAWQQDEGDDAVALCMRDRDPFEGGVDSEFFRIAKEVWPAPIGYLEGLG